MTNKKNLASLKDYTFNIPTVTLEMPLSISRQKADDFFFFWLKWFIQLAWQKNFTFVTTSLQQTMNISGGHWQKQALQFTQIQKINQSNSRALKSRKSIAGPIQPKSNLELIMDRSRTDTGSNFMVSLGPDTDKTLKHIHCIFSCAPSAIAYLHRLDF